MFLDGWMGGWVGGWMDGWMEVKAVLRIAYSNQKQSLSKFFDPQALFALETLNLQIYLVFQE
jgi:hypothetical protein